MSNDDKTEEYVREAAKIACTFYSGGEYKLCDFMFGDGFEDLVNKVYSWLPDSLKAAGVTDYWSVADPIFDGVNRVWDDTHNFVDQVWNETRKRMGMTAAPSPASQYLNDWLDRNAWLSAPKVSFADFISGSYNPDFAKSMPDGGAAFRNRTIELTPSKGPWAYRYKKWPKVCDDGCQNIFRLMLSYLYGEYRIKPIMLGVANTLSFITAVLSKREFEFDPGLIAKAVWIHGNTIEAESPEELAGIDIKGWGSTFHGRRGTLQWFHTPLTVPVFEPNHQLLLSKVFLQFETSKNVFPPTIKYIHIYDGAVKIRDLGELHLSGSHAINLDHENTHLLFPFQKISHGLGISIGVYFPKQTDNSWITFSAAGADFIESKSTVMDAIGAAISDVITH